MALASCRWSKDRHYHHAAVSNVIHRALATARIPSHLDPPYIYHSDGATIVPWEKGKVLV